MDEKTLREIVRAAEDERAEEQYREAVEAAKRRLREIVRAAEDELAEEQYREAVEAAKRRLRQQRGRGPWQRLVSKLPFTIRIERRTQ